jgi:hypothetical protein
MPLLSGTAFFVTRRLGDSNTYFPYVITAKHIIDNIRDAGANKVCLRLNRKDGNANWIETEIMDWYFHPDDSEVDVALLKMSLPLGSDHLYLPLTGAPVEQIMDKYWIGIGDEVCIAGLFSGHYGTTRNIPIVRIGNIAAMPEERVQTKMGLIDAYLIEARSIGGISGSPVFLNMGFFRVINNEFTQNLNGPMYYLMGLVHGHLETHNDDMNSCQSEVTQFKVNMGIAIVVPAEKILEVINQPAIRKKEESEKPLLMGEITDS